MFRNATIFSTLHPIKTTLHTEIPMKQLLLLLFLCTSSSLLAQNKLIQEAMSNYDYETAIALIEKEKPTTPLLFQKGKAQRGLSRNAEALSSFKQVIAMDSLNSLYFIEAAECCKTLAKNKEALKYYQQALDLNPNNKYVRLQYISSLCTDQQFEEALGESSILSETDSSLVVLHLQAQATEGVIKSVDAALGNYLLIQDKYPADYLAAAKLGSIYNLMQQYDYAIEATEKYRRIDSTNLTVNRQNALSYCLIKDYPNAIKRYEALTAQGDSTFLTCYYLGISYYAQEKYYETHDILEAIRSQTPDNIDLLYYLGRACSKTSWKKEGVEYLEKAIDLSIPKDSAMMRLYKGMIDCYKLAGKHQDQVAAIKKLYNNYDPTNHKLLYDIAYVYNMVLKDTKSGEHYLEAFLKTRPKDMKEKPAELNDKGELVLGLVNYYNAAQDWIEDLRKHSKKEQFFKEGVPR